MITRDELVRVRALLVTQRGAIDEVGAPTAGALNGVRAAPGVDLRMVAAQKHVRYRLAAEFRGARVLLVLKQAPTDRLALDASGAGYGAGSREALIHIGEAVAQHAGQQANDVWVIDGSTYGEVLIPVIDQVIAEIPEEGPIAVTIMDGIIDAPAAAGGDSTCS